MTDDVDSTDLPYFNEPVGDAYAAAIVELHALARELAVSYAIHYDESQNLWYIDVTSAAPSECYTSKDRSLSLAMECGLDHLKRLKQDALHARFRNHIHDALCKETGLSRYFLDQALTQSHPYATSLAIHARRTRPHDQRAREILVNALVHIQFGEVQDHQRRRLLSLGRRFKEKGYLDSENFNKTARLLIDLLHRKYPEYAVELAAVLHL